MKNLVLLVIAVMAISFSANAQKKTFWVYVESAGSEIVTGNNPDKYYRCFTDIVKIETEDYYNNKLDYSLVKKLTNQYLNQFKSEYGMDDYLKYTNGNQWVRYFEDYDKADLELRSKRNKAKREGETVKRFVAFKYID